MSDIKFRAWHKKERRYYYNVEHTYDHTCRGIGCFEESFGDVLDSNAYIVEQYTGLKDKKDNGIYEGDILGGIWEGCYIDRCDKCKQHQVFTTFGCMACSGDIQWYEIANDNNLEVVGNIHENADLLEG